MWDGRTRTLYIQVGLGSGTADGSVVGDHDLWRLPQKDDTDSAHPFLKNRPVFGPRRPGRGSAPTRPAGWPPTSRWPPSGTPRTDRAEARAYLATAAQIYGLADTDPGALVTTVPYGYYPETSWKDDMALGGAELALAAQQLHDPRASQWLAQAAWSGRRATRARPTRTP